MILFILIGSFLIRLIALNQSLWLDEAISANVARNFNFWEIINRFSPTDFHPPLYYLFLNFWGHIFGYSEMSLRMPSVVFSIITIYTVYLIGKLIKNRKTGLWAAILLAINPLFIYYSQEVRMYLLATVLLSVSIYYFFKIIKSKNIIFWDIFLFNLFSFLSFASFYGSIFLILCFGIYFLFKKKFKLFFITNIGTILIILILAPLLLSQINHSKIMLQVVSNWGLVLGKVNLKNLLLIPLKFGVGRISFNPKMLYYLISGIWTIIIFWQVIKGGVKNKLLGFLLIMPIILGLLFSIFSPLMQYFRFLYLLPIMTLLIAIGVKKSWQKIIIVLGFLGFSLFYLLNPKMYREDWKSLTANLDKNDSVYMIGSFADPIEYYRSDIKIYDLRNEISDLRIKVIPYGEIIHGFNHDRELQKLGYKKISENNFREVKLEKWKK